MGEYGYSIEHILMVDIIPDPAVRKAMNEINAGIYLIPFDFTENVDFFVVFPLGSIW